MEEIKFSIILNYVIDSGYVLVTRAWKTSDGITQSDVESQTQTGLTLAQCKAEIVRFTEKYT
jgi:hypothetical protein